jgi:GNAT superfamily N-acetyltransferase
MTRFCVREATEDDFESIYFLLKEFSIFIKTPQKFKITIEQMKNEKDFFHCIVAVNEKDIIIGYATYFYAFYSWIGKSLYLDDLYVVEQHRGQRIGSQMMDRILEIAKISNCKKVRWQVSNWNQKAIEFYKYRGVVIDDVEINCDLIL